MPFINTPPSTLVKVPDGAATAARNGDGSEPNNNSIPSSLRRDPAAAAAPAWLKPVHAAVAFE